MNLAYKIGAHMSETLLEHKATNQKVQQKKQQQQNKTSHTVKTCTHSNAQSKQ